MKRGRKTHAIVTRKRILGVEVLALEIELVPYLGEDETPGFVNNIERVHGHDRIWNKQRLIHLNSSSSTT